MKKQLSTRQNTPSTSDITILIRLLKTYHQSTKYETQLAEHTTLIRNAAAELHRNGDLLANAITDLLARQSFLRIRQDDLSHIPGNKKIDSIIHDLTRMQSLLLSKTPTRSIADFFRNTKNKDQLLYAINDYSPAYECADLKNFAHYFNRVNQVGADYISQLQEIKRFTSNEPMAFELELDSILTERFPLPSHHYDDILDRITQQHFKDQTGYNEELISNIKQHIQFKVTNCLCFTQWNDLENDEKEALFNPNLYLYNFSKLDELHQTTQERSTPITIDDIERCTLSDIETNQIRNTIKIATDKEVLESNSKWLSEKLSIINEWLTYLDRMPSDYEGQQTEIANNIDKQGAIQHDLDHILAEIEQLHTLMKSNNEHSDWQSYEESRLKSLYKDDKDFQKQVGLFFKFKVMVDQQSGQNGTGGIEYEKQLKKMNLVIKKLDERLNPTSNSKKLASIKNSIAQLEYKKVTNQKTLDELTTRLNQLNTPISTLYRNKFALERDCKAIKRTLHTILKQTTLPTDDHTDTNNTYTFEI